MIQTLMPLLESLASKAPVDLDVEREYVVDGVAVNVGWQGDKQFVVSLPAWVFRDAKRILAESSRGNDPKDIARSA